MRLWIDTEFNEYRGELISMALVAEDGREWYGVRHCQNPKPWVAANVMPYLHRPAESDEELMRSLDAFLAQFDEVRIVADWPTDIAQFCTFIEFEGGKRIGPPRMVFEIRDDLPDTAKKSLVPHNALHDAWE